MPLDYDFDYNPVVEEQIEQPFLEGKATWYDYKLGNTWWSKSHDTCALRVLPKYWHYKVCAWDKCVECRHNDRWPARQDRVIDLSSHAFKQLAPLSKWVVQVKIYKLD